MKTAMKRSQMLLESQWGYFPTEDEREKVLTKAAYAMGPWMLPASHLLTLMTSRWTWLQRGLH
jgi:hypothetical protein